MVEHDPGELVHDGFCLHMEVVHHGIAVPSPEEFDGVHVHLATEQGHGTARPKGSSADIPWGETCFPLQGGSSQPQDVSHVGSFDGN